MAKVLDSTNKAGSRKVNEPRLIGDIMKEMFRGNSPLARGYRSYLAAKETDAEKGGKDNG